MVILKVELIGSGTVLWHARNLLATGKIDYEGFMEMTTSASPSVGHCNTMGTALSMNALAEHWVCLYRRVQVFPLLTANVGKWPI